MPFADKGVGTKATPHYAAVTPTWIAIYILIDTNNDLHFLGPGTDTDKISH